MKVIYGLVLVIAAMIALHTHKEKVIVLTPKFSVGDRVTFTPTEDYSYYQCYSIGVVEEIVYSRKQILYVIKPRAKKPYDCIQEVIDESNVRSYESIIDYDKIE